MRGDLLEAIESFHKALGIRRDDTFSTTMLNFVVERMIGDDPPYSGELIFYSDTVLYLLFTDLLA